MGSGDICLRGGGFIDDITKTSPFLGAFDIPDRLECRHSDLGFRIAAMIPFDLLPKQVQEPIRLFPELDIAEYVELPPVRELTDF